MSIHPILQKILDEKRKEIDLIRDLQFLPPPIVSSFRRNLESKSVPIIAECKKGSPSAGVIRDPYNPTEIAKIYEREGAGAISVLTDEKFFLGSREDLQSVVNSVKIPILRKDFIMDGKQILEARLWGASAILLIVRILSPENLESLLKYGRSLGMDVLVETHTPAEAGLAIEVGAEMIGINTRDLDTFKIIPGVIPEISSLIPDSIHCVGESGIHSAGDLREVLEYTDSALIGTYFMKSPDITLSFRELLAPPG